MKKLFLLLLIYGFVPTIFSAEEPAKPAAENNRFLFVVENTPAMKRSAKAAQQVVRELIENGVQGEMHAGDTFGVWTFDDQLNMTFPVQQWSPTESKAQAFRAADFLDQHRYENKGKLSVVLPKVYSLIKASKSITVILVSTGTEAIRGTPFDKEINTIYPQYSRELRDAKIPFVTILIGFEGRPVAYSVNSSIGPIRIPQPPLQSKTQKTNSVAATTNAAPAKVAEPLAAAKPAAKPIIITKKETKSVATNAAPVVAPEKLSKPIVAPPVSFAAEEKSTTAPVVTKSEPAAVTAETSPAKEVPPTAIETPKAENKIDSAVVKTSELVGHTKAVPPIATAPGVTPKAENEKQTIEPVAANEPAATMNEPSSPAPIVAASETTFGAKKLLVGGFGMLIVAGVLVFLLMRHSRKNQPSLISHSINRNR